MSKLKWLRAAGLGLAMMGLSGCVFVMSGTVSSTAAKGNAVSAEASDWGILHLSVPEDLTTRVNGQLTGACPSGKVSNVATELTLREFFLAQMYTVSATGLCQ